MVCAVLVAARSVAQEAPPEPELDLDLIVEDGDPAPGTEGGFDLGFFANGFLAPLIDATGRVYFFAATTDTDIFGLPLEGIWSGNGTGVTFLAVDGQILPQFTPTADECMGVGPTCGELFNTDDTFYVSPDGEVVIRTSREDAAGTLAILTGTASANLRPIVTAEQVPSFDLGALSRATEAGVYQVGNLIGDAPFGSGPGTSLIEGELTDFATPFIGEPPPSIADPVTIIGIDGTSASDDATVPALFGLNENADLLFRADLSDSTTALYLNPSAAGAPVTLLARSGETTPGIDFGNFMDIGQSVSQINNNQTGFVLAFWNDPDGLSPSSDNAREGIWRFDAGGNLTLVVSERASIVTDPTYQTAGVFSGSSLVAFSSLGSRFFNPVIAPNGDIYFIATGQQVDADGALTGDEAQGLWRAPADDGPLELVFRERNGDIPGTSLLGGDQLASNGFGQSLYGFDEEGRLIIDLNAQAPDNTITRGVYLREADGTLRLIVEEGQEIEVAPGVTRTVDSFSFNSDDYLGGTTASFRNGRLAFNVEFTDNTVAIFRASFTGPDVAITDFVWSGACGDSNWHAICADSNWNDPDGVAAELAPGDQAGTESVTIDNADVVIADRAVHLDALSATGSLEVDAPLLLENASAVEDLVLSADLTLGNTLTLSGDSNRWLTGEVSGPGTLLVGAGTNVLTLDPSDGSLDLFNTLEVGGSVVQLDGTLNLQDVDGRLVVLSGGEYEIRAGSIVDFTDGVHIENSGTFSKTSAATATIDAFFDNRPGANVAVREGVLRFTDPSNWAGTLDISAGATVEFDTTVATLGSMVGQGLSADGEGVLRFSGAEVIVGSGTENRFNLTGDEGKVEVTGGSTLGGDGLIVNLGNFELIDGTIEADVDNAGVFTLIEAAGIALGDGTMSFTNGGALRKTGAGTSVLGVTADGQLAGAELAFVNDGTIDVTEGTLVFDNVASQLMTIPTLLMNNGGSVAVADGATLAITDSFVQFSGETTANGAGRLVFGDPDGAAGQTIAFDNGTLVNGITGSGLFENALAAGVTINPGTAVRGAGGIENFGELSFTGGTIEEATITNMAGGILVVGGDASDERRLGATLLNEGDVVQTATLTLDAMGKVDNQSDYILFGATDIVQADGVASIFGNGFVNAGGLVKEGAGTARLDVLLDNSGGGIDVRDGQLLIAKASRFNDSTGGVSDINLSGGTLTLGGLPADKEHVFFGRTGVLGTIGDSKLLIDGNVVVKELASLVVSGSVEWRSGTLRLDAGEGAFLLDTKIVIGGDNGPGEFSITGQPKRLDGVGLLEVASGGRVVQDVELTVDTSVPVFVDGHYRMAADFLREGDADFLFTVRDTGVLEIPQSTAAALQKTFNVDTGGTVQLGNSAVLSDLTLDGRLFDSVEGTLNAGNWLLGAGAQVREAASTPVVVSRLGAGTGVVLNNGSSLFNLPTVDGDFRVDQGAELRLNNTTFTVTGNYNNDGLLNGSNALMLVGGNFNNNANSVLTGDGVTIAVNLNNAGTIAPGSSPGVITIDGNYTQAATGVLQIELGGTEAGMFDQLIVNGTASFAAGSIIDISVIDPNPNDGMDELFIPETGDLFNFLLADEIVLGDGVSLNDLFTFTGLPRGLKFDFDLAMIDDAQALRLMAIFGSSLRDLGGLTAAQAAIAAALDDASIGTGSAALLDFALAIDGLDSDAARRDALDQANLSFGSALFDLSTVAARAGADHVGRHLDLDSLIRSGRQNAGSAAGNAGSAALGATEDGITNLPSGEATLFEHNGLRVFLAGSYDVGDFDESANQTGFDYDGGAGTIGAEYADEDARWLAGFAGTASVLNAEAELGRGDLDLESYALSAYGLARFDRAVVDGIASYGWIRGDYRRNVTLPGQAFIAGAKPEGNFLTVTGRFAMPLEFGRATLGPIAQLSYTDIDIDRFVESGGGDASLDVAGSGSSYLAGQLGVRGSVLFDTGWGTVEPRLSAAYQDVFDDDSPVLNAHFAGGSDNPFIIPTDENADGALALGAGLVIRSGGRITVSADYHGLLLDDGGSQHAIVARLRGAF